MRGTKVIARCFGGVASVLRVWDAGDGLVYLSSEGEFSKLEAGREALPPIGFPVGDVFTYDAAAVQRDGGADWKRLKRWKPYKVVAAGD